MNSEFNSLIRSRNLTELPYQKDLLTNPLYQSSNKPIVFAAGTSAGKTFTMIMWLELFYKNTKGYKPTLIIPASKTVLRDNTEEAMKEFKPTFSYSIITNRNDLELAIKNKIQVIVALPQTLNKSIDILPKFERFVLDEAHQWYFQSVVKKVISKTKPNVQLLLTGSPYRFNAQADKFIFKYVPVMELYDLGHVHNAKIEVVSSAYDFKQTDWLSSYGNLKSQKTNSVSKAKTSLDIVCDEMINKLRSTTKSKYTRNWNAANKFSSLFNELDKTIIYTHSKKQADTFHKILNSKKGLEGKVLISHSENDGKSELFKQFQTDDSIKILIAVDRGRLGFNMPNLYNIVDFTMTQSLEMLQQMYGRLLRKSPTGKQKCYYKVATKNTAEYYVDLMTAMLCLATNDDPTYYYSMYNGKNMGGIRIPKALLNNKKRTKGSSNSSKSKSSKPYVSLTELGIPNDLNIFRQSILHSSDGSFDSIAWTTLDEVRGKFFNITTKQPKLNGWTMDEMIEEAKKHKGRNDFMINGKGAYQWARKIGKLDEVCKHMKPFFTFWNEKNIREEAKKYKTKKEFKTNSIGAVTAAKRLGIYEDVCSHMEAKFIDWSTPENQKLLICEIKKAKSRNDLFNKNRAAHGAATRFGLIEKYFPLKPGDRWYNRIQK